MTNADVHELLMTVDAIEHNLWIIGISTVVFLVMVGILAFCHWLKGRKK